MHSKLEATNIRRKSNSMCWPCHAGWDYEAEENSKRPADDGPVVTPELMRVYYEKVRPARLALFLRSSTVWTPLRFICLFTLEASCP